MQRPDELPGYTHRRETPVGKVYITVNLDEDMHPYEVFVRLGKAGSLSRAWSESLARMISVSLQNGTPLPVVCKQLSKVKSERARGDLSSLPQIVADVLTQYDTLEGERDG